MNREILFRGKRTDTGEWVFGSLYQERRPFIDEIIETFIVEWRKDLCLVSGAPSNNHWWRAVDPSTISQFTGLHDNDVNKIFEDDACLFEGTTSAKGRYPQSSDSYLDHEEIGILTFRNNGFVFVAKTGRILSIPRGTRPTIIGNIHDNPELLNP